MIYYVIMALFTAVVIAVAVTLTLSYCAKRAYAYRLDNPSRYGSPVEAYKNVWEQWCGIYALALFGLIWPMLAVIIPLGLIIAGVVYFIFRVIEKDIGSDLS